ncbi:ABC transporter ATP-binding protein [Antarcticirhabdus aurantiaca]|uniref:ABC transporter ATP-binding protein n=1 Tax=Antarcticirhabdus aurantiaca TaxID=2606717 RepID=A0ACD4NHA9_9HYPH|nr:ABC transporter ATP-binding protein [Antarcticirhabdus aurantiaca]WAJ26153.1 ABC transporter ATP-binding protein [Jeongeuplla avenae]
MVGILLRQVSKSYGGTCAVDDLDLEVEDGAFLALLGPSGCGKTTVLRLLAGLERPDGGTIALGERVVAGEGIFVEPEDRGLGMVFQSYALWPHMTVEGNVSFGLHGRGLDRSEIAARVAQALDLVGLSAKAGARPHQLSGGQRQRVALARSLAMRPRLILLDEPLANLDANLRASMAAEFRRIHAETRTTFVFVTHDQAEAMALATRVAVLNGGRLQQVGAPEDIWHRPASPAVARFVGNRRLLPVEVLGASASDPARRDVRLAEGVLSLPGPAPAGPGWLCLRPDGLALAEDGPRPPGEPLLGGTVRDGHFEGGHHLLTVDLARAGEAIAVQVRSPVPLPAGAVVRLRVVDGWLLPRDP